jgi:hypothetical protein
VQALDPDTERKTIAEQIIDEILATDPNLYDVYTKIRNEQTRRTPYRREREPGVSKDQQDTMGYFISKWIIFEGILKELIQRGDPKASRYGIPSGNMLANLAIFDDEALSEVERLRRIRNNLVHGVEVPDQEFLRQAGRSLELLIDRLRDDDRLDVRNIVQQAIGTSAGTRAPISSAPSQMNDQELFDKELGELR